MDSPVAAPGRPRRQLARATIFFAARAAQEVLLFTDLANPVSNSIYQRIGYREVEDRVVLSFTER